jgi:hypothetical protein
VTRFVTVIVLLAVLTISFSASATLIHRSLYVVLGDSNAMDSGSYSVNPYTDKNYYAPAIQNGADTHDYLAWTAWDMKASIHSVVSLDSPQFRSDGSQIFGPELGLARGLWNRYHVGATFVKGAPLNASVANWLPASTITYLKELVTKIKATIAFDRTKGYADTVRGFYWNQGVADVNKTTIKAQYVARLKVVISYLRQAFAASTAPLVIGELDLSKNVAYRTANGGCNNPYLTCAQEAAGNDVIRSAQVAMVTGFAHTYIVDTRGLTRDGNQVHLDDAGDLTFGYRLAKVTP